MKIKRQTVGIHLSTKSTLMKTEIIIGKHAHVTCKNESPPEKGGISESSNQKKQGLHKQHGIS